MPMIEVKKLSKKYRISKNNIVDAVTNLTFEIEKGEVVTLVGPSGSGKSTLLSILGGLDREYHGEVFVNGKEVRDYNSNYYRRFVVGTIFQQFYLIPALTVEENIALPRVFSKQVSKKELKKKTEYLLERVGLTDRRHHKPKELSGGQAQRVAIARSLISNPKILLADEPTGNLDSKTGQDIMDLLLQINKEQNTTLMIVTHDTELITGAQRKIFLKDGHLDLSRMKK
jgi:putative ABC transport system ATP-binding protein